MVKSGHIDNIFKSRKHIIELLDEQGYDISDYKDFSVHEVHTMYKAKQMDMLFKKKDKKAYVIYHLEKGLKQQNIQEYIDDLFVLENILTKNDDIIIIIKDEPNESLIKVLKNIWEQQGIFITVFNIRRLQFNILKHTLVPKHRLLSPEEENHVREKYNISDDDQFPEIGRFSPVALAIGLRPGSVCEIIRDSRTAISTKFYRICTR
tara:strand:+ start:9857 stop:10477 length:621 start_codon:yes stop_codon:yes gene_type:complete